MSPEFVTSNETAVAENIAANTVVMAVKAVDRDEGRNGYIEYNLAEDAASRGVFSLGPVDGLLRVSGRIDRELKSSYTLLVTARDKGDPPRLTQTQIFVKVLDENDNSPVFDPKQYSASIAENASIGASVLQVSSRASETCSATKLNCLVVTEVQFGTQFVRDLYIEIVSKQLPGLVLHGGCWELYLYRLITVQLINLTQ